MKLLGHLATVVFGLCTTLLLLAGLSWAAPIPGGSLFSVLSLFVPLLMMGSFFGFLYRWRRRNDPVNFHLFVLLSSGILMGSFFQFSGGSASDTGDDTFSVLSFNTRKFNENGELSLKNADSIILDFIRDEDSDIVCLQECYYAIKASRELEKNYPYKFVDFIYSRTVKNDHVVHGILSKYPIVNTEVIEFPGSFNRAVYADIDRDGEIIRVFSVHLQSYKIVPKRDLLENGTYGNLLQRMSWVMRKQNKQAALVRAAIEASPYPTIVTGDFNNTQYSRAYRTISRDMSDSFREKGRGFGRTFDLFRIPMRIDFVLADSGFEFTHHHNYNVELSDHFPIRAELRRVGE